jgi:hypothetical protein
MSAVNRRKKKMNKILVITVIFLFIAICFPLTTYYPSPNAVYQKMRLFPQDISSGEACDKEGALVYSTDGNQLLYCDGSNWQPQATSGKGCYTAYARPNLASSTPANYCLPGFHLLEPIAAINWKTVWGNCYVRSLCGAVGAIWGNYFVPAIYSTTTDWVRGWFCKDTGNIDLPEDPNCAEMHRDEPYGIGPWTCCQD